MLAIPASTKKTSNHRTFRRLDWSSAICRRCRRISGCGKRSQNICALSALAIAGIDTRRLTRMLRTQGAQNGCIVTGEDAVARVDQAIERAQKAAAMQGSE